ncbi:C-C chemokine receptor type 8-like [Pimephales promelas]|uniref:C-C chemokine receptor type 8-like n=1 Tax=Pimephales promelas TaxID=90988 RepID=UPI001955694A|nr:C-C chemokine receptor type 8-like [Pimephales promelas]
MELMNGSIMNFTTPEASTNPTESEHRLIIVIFVLGFHFMLGLFTHSYVIWIIVRGTASGLASEFFNLNLSVFEDVLSLNSLFALLAIRFPSLNIISHFLVGLSTTGRPLFQCLICVECYLAVVHPVTFLKYKPLRYRVICCTAAWIIIIGSCLFSMIFLVFLSEMAHTWFYTLHFLLFFFVQMFFLVAVLIALKHSGPGERGQENPIKRRAFYLILLTTINLSIIYVPTAIAGLHKIVTKGDIPAHYEKVGALLSKISSKQSK